MRRALLLLVWFCCLVPAGQAAPTFLFDATKAETAGNADWVVDEDNKVVGRYPTPAASGITASTAETYWTGALSSWGVALVQLGYGVESLPVGGRITYLDSTNAQDLSNYQAYVVCEPNILFTAAERTAIIRYVQDGGSLFVISDHVGSDRNNDGSDSVAIWNDFFTNNGVQANPFGLTINSSNVSLVSSYVDTAADDPLSNGPLGAASLLKYSNGATLTLSTAANPTVRGVFWTDAAHSNNTAMAAYGRFGAGRFVALCDSSPIDDGTGSSGHTLYYGWTEEGTNHSNLVLNASLWLAARDGGAPYNDHFANAAPLDPGATVASGSNVGATSEPGEPAASANATGQSVWWQFSPANGGTATISTVGSDFDTVLAVYTGSAVNALTLVAQNDNADATHTYSTVAFPVTAGTTYRFAVDGAGGGAGHVALALSFPAPANDLFANATVVPPFTASTVYNGNNFNAGVEAGEPSHAGYASTHTVWWRWTPTTTGPVTISTVGSNFDTLLAVYTGPAVNALTATSSNANYGTSLQSQVSFTATAGTTYSIAVAGYTTATGNIVLTLSPGSASNVPVNDNFANATILSGTSAAVSTVTTYATKEPGEPINISSGEAHSVWWRWTAPGNGSVTLTTVGSSYDTTLGVYTGDTVSALAVLATDDDSGGSNTSKLAINVAADTTYLIKVDGYGGASGTAKLNLTYSASGLPAPANDNFANATLLSGTSANTTGTTVSATTETGEPLLYGGGHTVWYKWTAPSALIVSASSSSTNGTALGVFTGSAVNVLTNVITSSNGYAGFAARSGATYYFCVDSANASSVPGSFSFSFTTQAAPSMSVTVSPARVVEGSGTAVVFTLTPSAYASVPLTVRLSMGGTATSGTDYSSYPAVAADGSVTVTIPAYYSSYTFSVYALVDNDPTEGDESVVATLLAGDGYTVNATSASASVTIIDASPYSAAWESTYRAAGFSGAAAAPAADPDGDGITNLMEFALNLNPLAADPPDGLPTAGTGSFVDPADASGTARRFATLAFTRRTDAPGLTYAVETTSDLAGGGWTADGAVFVSASSVGMPANTERAVYRTARPMDGPNAVASQFLRLRVTAAQ